MLIPRVIAEEIKRVTFDEKVIVEDPGLRTAGGRLTWLFFGEMQGMCSLVLFLRNTLQKNGDSDEPFHFGGCRCRGGVHIEGIL